MTDPQDLQAHFYFGRHQGIQNKLTQGTGLRDHAAVFHAEHFYVPAFFVNRRTISNLCMPKEPFSPDKQQTQSRRRQLIDRLLFPLATLGIKIQRLE